MDINIYLTKPFKIIFLLILIPSTISYSQYHQIPLQPSVEILDIKVHGNAKKGDTFTLAVHYKAQLSTKVNVSLHLPKNAHFTNRDKEVKNLVNSDIELARNNTYVQRYSIWMDETGNGLYEIQIQIPHAPIGYTRSTSKWIKIHSDEQGFEIFDPENAGVQKAMVIGENINMFKGEHANPSKGKASSVLTQSVQNYTVSVSGKIRFLESNFPEKYKGVYGNAVVLWFRSSNNSGNWYHPIVGNTKHKHYDILDEQGNFSFNFSFSGDLSGFDELIVLVNTSNDIAIMPAPQDGYVSYSGGGYTSYFNESEGLQVAILPGQTNIFVNQNGLINGKHGRVLRYSQISKKYISELYNGAIPFSVPHIPTRITSSTSCGLFTNQYSFLQGWDQSISFNPDCTEFTTVSHEFGHWINYRMWKSDSKWNNANNALQEGFAIFYSFSVRNYSNRQYGDDLLSDDDNPEEDSFVISPYRYFGIRYAQPSAPSFGKEAAAFSSYLWNLYDNVQDLEFLANTYNSNDNDDVQNYSVRVFDKMRSLANAPGNESIFNYNSHFKSGLSNKKIHSIDKIYSFMFDNLNALPPTKMKPAQVKNLQAIQDVTTTTLTWASSSYSSGAYKNFESGYKIYKKNGFNWQLIGQTSNLSNTFVVSNPNSVTKYKVTSYNSSGESINAPEVEFGPLSTNIFGPTTLFGGQNGTWRASISNGSAPYTYLWQKRNLGSRYWYNIGRNASYTGSFSDDVDLKVKITDSNNNTASDIMRVIVKGDIMRRYKKLESETIPETFGLAQNYPNPFNPSTNIEFMLPEQAQVTLIVFNIMGQKVSTLVSQDLNAGFHTYTFDASSLPSGIYIAQQEAIGTSGEVFTKSMKMQLIK